MVAKEPGTAIIYWTDPNDRMTVDLITINTRGMLGANSMEQNPIVNYFLMKQVWKEGDKLNLAYICVTTDAVTTTGSSSISIPITIKNLHAGVYEEAEIEGKDSGKYSLVEDVLTGTAATRLRIAYYTCPAGIEFVLGKKRAFNSRLLLDIYDS